MVRWMCDVSLKHNFRSVQSFLGNFLFGRSGEAGQIEMT